MCVSSHSEVCHGRTWQPEPIPTPQPGAGQLGGTGEAPALGIRHLPGDRDRLRLGQDVDPQVNPAWNGPWPDVGAGPDVVLLGQGLADLEG